MFPIPDELELLYDKPERVKHDKHMSRILRHVERKFKSLQHVKKPTRPSERVGVVLERLENELRKVGG